MKSKTDNSQSSIQPTPTLFHSDIMRYVRHLTVNEWRLLAVVGNLVYQSNNSSVPSRLKTGERDLHARLERPAMLRRTGLTENEWNDAVERLWTLKLMAYSESGTTDRYFLLRPKVNAAHFRKIKWMEIKNIPTMFSME